VSNGKSGRLLVATFVAIAFATASLARAPVDALALGRGFTRTFYDGKIGDVWAVLSEGMRAEQGSVEHLADFRRTVDELVGGEAQLLGEKVLPEGGLQTYVRSVRYEKSAEPFEVRWTFDAGGRVTDFSIRPALPAIQFEYETKTKLRLPFDGEWFVGSGGRTPEQNGNHYYDYMSRFDSDLVRVEDARFDEASNPPRDEDFAGFGQPILAPAAGRIAMIRDGIADNPPGHPDLSPGERAGNFVVIDHGDGEFSFLAHLKKGSVRVRVGDSVEAGQVVAGCGNSGNSTGPHLHYGLRRAADPARGMSVPAQFDDYFVDGKPVSRGELQQGQKVQVARRR
jgi:peptidase M23-like protein